MNESETEKFVRANLPVAKSVIRKEQRNAFQSQADDIESDGLLGLLRSAATWTGEGAPPSGWVAVAVRRAIVDGMRSRLGRTKDAEGNYRRAALNAAVSLNAPLTTVGEAGEMTLGDVLTDKTNHAALTESLADLMPALDSLTWRDRHAIARVYLGGDTLLQVANDWGVTESRMSQICKAALRQLREHMSEKEENP